MSKRHTDGIVDGVEAPLAQSMRDTSSISHVATETAAMETHLGFRARAVRRARAFQNNDDGATAIEFAILSLPFCVLMFSILELAVIFFISAALDHGTSQAAREIRTGELQSDYASKELQLAEFRKTICEEMANLSNCDERLRVDLVADDSFLTTSLPASNRDQFASRPDDDYEMEDDGVTFKKDANGKRIRKTPPGPPASAFNCSAPRKVVLIRTEFYHDLVLPRRLTFLGNDPDGWNRRILTSTTAFRNEPFPATAGASCT